VVVKGEVGVGVGGGVGVLTVVGIVVIAGMVAVGFCGAIVVFVTQPPKQIKHKKINSSLFIQPSQI
jgi:hypothetical protein